MPRLRKGGVENPGVRRRVPKRQYRLSRLVVKPVRIAPLKPPAACAVCRRFTTSCTSPSSCADRSPAVPGVPHVCALPFPPQRHERDRLHSTVRGYGLQVASARHGDTLRSTPCAWSKLQKEGLVFARARWCCLLRASERGFVCVNVYIPIYSHTDIYTHVHTCIHTCMHTYVCTCVLFVLTVHTCDSCCCPIFGVNSTECEVLQITR
jgi:hypothetical protein